MVQNVDTDSAGQIARVVLVDVRHQGVQGLAFILGDVFQRVPKFRLDPQRGGMSANADRALAQLVAVYSWDAVLTASFSGASASNWMATVPESARINRLAVHNPVSTSIGWVISS